LFAGSFDIAGSQPPIFSPLISLCELLRTPVALFRIHLTGAFLARQLNLINRQFNRVKPTKYNPNEGDFPLWHTNYHRSPTNTQRLSRSSTLKP
jgi:hypothetical protein